MPSITLMSASRSAAMPSTSQAWSFCPITLT